MPDYKKGKIYKITSPNIDAVYVGSSTQTLNQRFNCHNWKSRTFANSKLCASHDVIKHGNARIELVEDFPCDDIHELEAKELAIIKKYRDDGYTVVNKQQNGKTIEEKKAHKADISKAYRERLGEELLEKKRVFHHANKEKIAEKAKEYRELNAELIKEQKKAYYDENRDKVLQKNANYRAAHHDEFLTYCKSYYEANKKRYKDNCRKPWTCDICSKTITMGGKSNHLKSQAHQNKMSSTK